MPTTLASGLVFHEAAQRVLSMKLPKERTLMMFEGLAQGGGPEACAERVRQAIGLKPSPRLTSELTAHAMKSERQRIAGEELLRSLGQVHSIEEQSPWRHAVEQNQVGCACLVRAGGGMQSATYFIRFEDCSLQVADQFLRVA